MQVTVSFGGKEHTFEGEDLPMLMERIGGWLHTLPPPPGVIPAAWEESKMMTVMEVTATLATQIIVRSMQDAVRAVTPPPMAFVMMERERAAERNRERQKEQNEKPADNPPAA